MTSSSKPLPLPLLVAGAAAFLTLGLLQAMYGPAFGLFERRYGVSVGSVGLIASAHFVGTALAPLLVGALLARFSVRFLVSVSLTVLAGGALLVALAPSWPLAVLGALIGGLGAGGISGALNSAYAALGTRAVNLVNAVFGVGSLLSPLLVAGLAANPGVGRAGLSFVVVAACAALTLGAARIWGLPTLGAPTRPAAAGRAGAQALLFALIVVCYTSLEVGLGAWADTHLRALGLGAAAAPLVVSGYWGGLTVGRVLTGLFGARVAPERLVIGSTLLVLACVLVATQAGAAVAAVAYVLAGLALAPIFGTTLAWMAGYLPTHWVAYLLVAGSVGGVIMPALLGRLYAAYGSGALPWTFAAVAALTCAFSVLTRQVLARRTWATQRRA